MIRPKIGLVTCVHPLYDLPAVAARRRDAIEGLRATGCEVIAAAVPRSPADAIQAAALLRRDGVDLVVLFFVTWVTEGVTLELARQLMDVPMLLWALPYLDRDIPMPSPMSGITASGSNIRRLGKRFTHVIGEVTPGILEGIARAARVAAVVGALRQARFGVFGTPCPGMLDVEAEDSDFEKVLGSTTVRFDLDALVAAADAASPAEAARAADRLTAIADFGPECDRQSLERSLQLYVALKETIRERNLAGYSVRCWPELRDGRKITPCTAHALLAEEGIPSTCEVDLPALIGAFVLARLADAPTFNFDITAYLEDEGAIQLAHCGAAAPQLAAPGVRPLLRAHMRTGTGATLEFPFKTGPATLAKLMRPFAGKLKLFVAEGQVISSEGIRGSVATFRPDAPLAVFMDTWIREAVEHHASLVYGRLQRDLELFCNFTGVELIRGQATLSPN
jgi:L-fucose isomerase-like protein